MAKEAIGGYKILPFDKWRAVTFGFVREIVAADVVVFTALVDAAALEQCRDRFQRIGKAKPSWTAFVVKAISLGLRHHPAMNRLLLWGWFRHRPVQLERVDAVVAVERVRNGEDTVYAQILRDTDRQPVWAISEELAHASRMEEEEDPRLRLFMKLVRTIPSAIGRRILTLPRWSPRSWVKHRGGSFALTTVGKYGIESIFVKWPWPLSFTFGEVAVRPMVIGGSVEPRLSFYLSLAWNRELTNGAPAARFFSEIVQRLGHAEFGDAEREILGPIEESPPRSP